MKTMPLGSPALWTKWRVFWLAWLFLMLRSCESMWPLTWMLPVLPFLPVLCWQIQQSTGAVLRVLFPFINKDVSTCKDPVNGVLPTQCRPVTQQQDPIIDCPCEPHLSFTSTIVEATPCIMWGSMGFPLHCSMQWSEANNRILCPTTHHPSVSYGPSFLNM